MSARTLPLRLGRRRTRLLLLCVVAAALLGGVPLTAHARSQRPQGRAATPEELQPSVEAAFPRESYAPGEIASLVFFESTRGVTLQLFQAGPERAPTMGDNELQGIPVTPARALGAVRDRASVRLLIGEWPSGLYFARLQSSDGRLGFAPFVLRPRRLGTQRVAVVMPTQTWQAYNVRDGDGDGVGDSWYASWSIDTASLGRPFLNRGVPYNFRRYDLPFLHWLAWNGHQADFLSDGDLNAVSSGAALARAYDLIVFPGHHEYVTGHEYDVVQQFRDLGGNLAFLSADNFFWRVVVKHGQVMQRTAEWRRLGRPEAALIGVQYRANDEGTHRGPWILRSAPADAWFLAGTGLEPGAELSSAGIEIDETAPSSPRNVQVLAEIPNLFGPGFTAQMTYYETPRGAKVFAAGAFTLAGAALEPDVSRLLTNVWAHLSER